MNFSIHLDEKTAASLAKEVSRQKRTRNSAITEAVKLWLEQSHRAKWPAELLDFEGSKELEPFEKHRAKQTGRARFP